MAVFCEPVVLVDKVEPPVAVFSLPVVLLQRVHLQYQVLYEPVVLAAIELYQVAVFPIPVVLSFNASIPCAVLSNIFPAPLPIVCPLTTISVANGEPPPPPPAGQ